MHVSIRAKCWDGERRKDMTPKVPEVTMPKEHKMDPRLLSVAGYVIPMMLAYELLPKSMVLAASEAPEVIPVFAPGTKERIVHAFDPLIGLIQSLSYPIAGVMIAGGCLFIMVGNRERGMDMLRNAAIGYILVQMSPMLLELLVGIGSNV